MQEFVKLDPKEHDIKHIYATAYRFLDKCTFQFDGDPKKEIIILAQPKGKLDLDAFKQVFLGELGSLEKYFTSLEENREVIKDVLQEALFGK